MSRSYLRNKWMKKEYDCSDRRNKHHLDEVSKNSPSRLITENCSADVERLNRPSYCGGHRVCRGGHRRVSGLVRASLKEKFRKELREEWG
jgi:hypothetical protein